MYLATVIRKMTPIVCTSGLHVLTKCFPFTLGTHHFILEGVGWAITPQKFLHKKSTKKILCKATQEKHMKQIEKKILTQPDAEKRILVPKNCLGTPVPLNM